MPNEFEGFDPLNIVLIVLLIAGALAIVLYVVRAILRAITARKRRSDHSTVSTTPK